VVSHRGVQQALVILAHDPGFVTAMHEDPDGALGRLGLSAAEKAQLLAVDRRAFATDPLRARRVLKVLAEELKVATTLALWETRSARVAEGFFGSSFFRAAVVDRTALAPAYGAYLAAMPLRTPQLPDVIRFETMLARCRRDVAPRGGVGLAPGVASGAFDAGVLETIQRVERFLFELALVPQLAFCADGPALPELPPVGAGTIYLAVTPAGLTHIDADLHRVLAALATPVARAEVARALAPAGVPPAKAEALVASLVEDGWVVGGDATLRSASRPA
jgi:hypothetical protein